MSQYNIVYASSRRKSGSSDFKGLDSGFRRNDRGGDSRLHASGKIANNMRMKASSVQKIEITPQVVKEHGLSADEYQRILSVLGREPNLVELGIFSVMWSEHCSY